MAVTRLGLEGYGVRRAGSFASKTLTAVVTTAYKRGGFVMRMLNRMFR